MQQLELVPYLLYEKEDNGILWIKFNRPEMLNAAVGGAERTARWPRSASTCAQATTTRMSE